ncbi:MAG TPA: hypothetical protein VL501_06085 [Pyrinomonadaceae bacterium]|nr:hypothetical protein [Pyrinomonadaceae bacterium]
MTFDKDSAVARAKRDLAERLNIDVGEVAEIVTEQEFPDMALGAAEGGEMAAQMISSGWRIELVTGDRMYEYRADKYQLRLYNFRGENYVVE